MPVSGPSRTLLGILVSAMLSTSPVWAQDEAQAEESKRVCVDDSDQGQLLRDQGKLLAAEQRFIACMASQCPAIVRDACAGWLDETRRRIPSLVLRVRDAAGRDVLPDAVRVDGRDRPDLVSGRSVSLDPGPHEVTVVVAGQSHARQLVLREGERDRAVEVTLPAPPPPPPPPASGRSVSPWVVVLGGAGVALLGTSVGLGLDTRARADRLRDSCGPHCPDRDVDPLRRELWFGEAALAGAALCLGGATWLFLADGQSEVGHRPVARAGVRASVGRAIFWAAF
jgi:hypothetical protein